MIWTKITEKCDKLVGAFKLFQSFSSPGRVSFNDFVIGLEQIGAHLETQEIEEVFNFLDTNRDGYLDYNEFCGMSEERRRGIDPFDFYGKESNNELKIGFSSMKFKHMINSHNLHESFCLRQKAREGEVSKSYGRRTSKADKINDLLSH